MGYHAINENNTFIYFQNGMDNATPDAQASSQLLQNLLNRPVGNIINDTQGIANDIAEYLPNYLETKDILNEYTYRKLNAKGQPTLIVTHSAGNEDMYKALTAGSLYQHQYPNLSFITVGSPRPQKMLNNTITHAGAQHLAHIGDWRDPVTYAKTATITALGLTGGGAIAGIIKGMTVGVPLGAAGGPLGVFATGLIGGAVGGGSTLYGVRYYHPFSAYMQKPELQQILQGWQQQHLSRPEPARVPQHKK
jgi:filamentous hemagglutinin